MQLGYWNKVGNVQDTGYIQDILFRSSSDAGNPQIKVSYNWWVWRVNEELKYVGSLDGENRLAEIGSVMPPQSIVHRIKTGVYDRIYPDFE